MTIERARGGVADAGSWPRPRVPARARAHQFYLAITLLLIAIVVRGFWPSYFGLVLAGGVSKPLVIHMHGVIFSGWMALLLLQVSLAAAGRLDLHRRVGSAGVVYGALVLAIGLTVSFVAPVLHMRAGEMTLDEASGFLLLPLVDMVLFGGFFGGAILYRREPEIHKRLILAATVALAFAAVARMPLGFPVQISLWLAPLVAGMVFDKATRGRVHRVYVVSFAILAVACLRVFLQQSAVWLPVGRALLAPFV